MARRTASTVPEQGTLFEDRFLEDYAGQIMRDPAVALVELVANAWDAYATKVDITCGQTAGLHDEGARCGQGGVMRTNAPRQRGGQHGHSSDADTIRDAGTVTVHIPLAFRRQSGRKVLVVPAGTTRLPSTPTRSMQPTPSKLTPTVRALARAFRWRGMIETGIHSTVQDIATAEKMNPSYVSRILRLTLLAPSIVERLLDSDSDRGMDRFMKPFTPVWPAQSGGFMGPEKLRKE